jgi:hypothetical protein
MNLSGNYLLIFYFRFPKRANRIGKERSVDCLDP